MSRGKRLEEDMPATHPPARSPAAGSEGGGPGSATVDRAALRRRLLSAADAEERAATLRFIQDTYGNAVAEELIQEARIVREPEEEEGG